MTTDDWIAFDEWLFKEHGARLESVADDTRFNIVTDKGYMGRRKELARGMVRRSLLITFVKYGAASDAAVKYVDFEADESVGRYLLRRAISIETTPTAKAMDHHGLCSFTYRAHGFKRSIPPETNDNEEAQWLNDLNDDASKATQHL